MTEYYAHSFEGKPVDEWHRLEKHLVDTANLAKKFADEFGSGDWAYLAGLWHDFGKYSEDFQKMLLTSAEAYIETKLGKVDHSTAGAIHAVEKFNKAGRIFSYLIAGHHAGLADWLTDTAGRKSLEHRLQNVKLLKDLPLSNVPHSIIEQILPKQKFMTKGGHALWIRMLYSCLVDADFLDTEAFLESEKAKTRKDYPSLNKLLPLFESYMVDKQAKANNTFVNKQRAGILRQCIEKSSHKPAIFTLTVPTGGGKTLSSMAFALNHAVKHNKKRIIYVIPYTSIIEQTAEQFREIFNDAVVEHHSNVDVSDESRETVKSRLACENWDATVIVTTSVQFFESLFSNRSSRCRKLHNIVNSVVVLDEVQLLPPEYLNPLLRVMKELNQNYKVTFILSTATQPAFTLHKSVDYQFEGLADAIEIIQNPLLLHKIFKRVEVHIPDDLLTPITWEDLTSELAQHPSVLCIVNRRDDCRTVYDMMPGKGEDTFHLSALMCGEHRSKVIGQIKQRLKDKMPTRVISTQLVEAGVDFDFPIVYRAIAGLDSIAQAAGRCNREGRLEKGKVFVFTPPSKIPAGYLRQAAEIGRRLLADKSEDVLSPDRFERFFKELYWLQGNNLDKYNILKDLAPDGELRFSFLSAAWKFKLIDESQYAPVIVRYEEGSQLIEMLKRLGPEKWLMRKLQRYVVNLPKYVHAKLYKECAIIEAYPGIFVQEGGVMYHPELGFCPDKSMIYEPDDLMC
ncbi:CRISPR-associated helicase/endonuclease Cas3 [Candidatus Brocadia sapporoensis]|uniref:CRISPR-associated helicase/endonuclease Cas3 n=1 Tax=Candidatus Brocadia sapporoensis TaxID=392547 RepID=A0A1V6M0U2_9BACT|nr:CRISPR-associated helicase/endonuclease Cas3 [Candidatus Brocadia sapporoensis]OQD45987.1 CRISPR-associated helicase/endonuclease Cas3 [Candidatus Brocadia sapporoensis]GJQ23439.1 MAG: CRISPR-associated helicase Cas3 [Candidatus Brocadia sapporoensis]